MPGITLRKTLTRKVRTYLSLNHIFAATHFAKLAKNVEYEEVGLTTDLTRVHPSYVTGAVLSAVAFVEATINESIADVREEVGPRFAAFSKNGASRAIQEADKSEVFRRLRTLERYQLVLLLSGGVVFDRGRAPWQNAQSLVELRNDLVHYRPEWVGGSPHRLEGRFRGSWFFDGSGGPFWPYKCLGYGCARWAVDSSVAFVDEFLRRVGITPSYHDLLREAEG